MLVSMVFSQGKYGQLQLGLWTEEKRPCGCSSPSCRTLLLFLRRAGCTASSACQVSGRSNLNQQHLKSQMRAHPADSTEAFVLVPSAELSFKNTGKGVMAEVPLSVVWKVKYFCIAHVQKTHRTPVVHRQRLGSPVCSLYCSLCSITFSFL